MMPMRRPRKLIRIGAESDPLPKDQAAWSMDMGRRIGIVLSAIMFRVRVAGLERVPASGPLLVVANHTAFADGQVMFGLIPRRVSYLIKAEAVAGPLGFVLNNVGQYAIDRDTPSREVLLAALDQLRVGGSVGVFPEGTRGDGLVRQVQAGAGWLAARSGATVLPVALRGTARPAGSGRRFRPTVSVLVGEPFTVAQGGGKSIVEQASSAIQQRLSTLVGELDGRLAADGKVH